MHLSSYSNSGVFSTLGFCIGLRLSDCCTLESHLLFLHQSVNTLPSCIRISPLYYVHNSKFDPYTDRNTQCPRRESSIIVLLSSLTYSHYISFKRSQGVWLTSSFSILDYPYTNDSKYNLWFFDTNDFRRTILGYHL